MSILDIVTIPAESLRKKSLPIEEITTEIRKFIDDMVETLDSKPGLGLAAPQVGRNIRAVIIESKETRDEDGNIVYEKIPLMVLINPAITHYSRDKIEMDEGCFSVPNKYGPVTRPKKIKFEAINIDGKKVKGSASGLVARIIQHEIDHLDGILFIDKVSDPSKIKTIESEKDLEGTI
jgi:peptide deformylase